MEACSSFAHNVDLTLKVMFAGCMFVYDFYRRSPVITILWQRHVTTEKVVCGLLSNQESLEVAYFCQVLQVGLVKEKSV